MSEPISSQYEPGSVENGNFANYYTFYPPQERMQLIPFDLLFSKGESLLCLDIGCNTGELTVALYNEINNHQALLQKGNSKILGVDLDPILIQRAVQANTSQYIKFECVNVLNEEFNSICNSFLNFHSKVRFDVIFIFSVTMWIHLNNGDEGLKLFLKNISEKTDLIVLEPQPWKCYKAAVRRRKRAKKSIFKFWDEIKSRDTIEEDLSKYLYECSFECIWKSDRTSWGRIISLYKRIER
ncbi:hypothetical protein O3M35_005447 [Rhynocoris fuscipes]|uniref:RNA methyltransferase n=1 Tax=Rhynocoris fuscipes TaxID=488301 RepID=A0AAW1DKH3_9HEMI